METCKEIIARMGRNRKIPQFFYCAEVSRINTAETRQAIRLFLKGNTNAPEIDFILHSGGGDPDAAYKIIRVLKRRFTKVNVIVPLWAKSAATLLSLGLMRL